MTALISLGGIVLSRSLCVGGYEMDEALGHYMRGAHQLVIGSRTAEAIKLAIGSAHPLADELIFAVRGRHIISGLPSEVQLHSEEVREALRAPLREILSAITETLEQTPRKQVRPNGRQPEQRVSSPPVGASPRGRTSRPIQTASLAGARPALLLLVRRGTRRGRFRLVCSEWRLLRTERLEAAVAGCSGKRC